ncbi:hypothetical protein NDU88_001248 [Pleurodeles waltl]|uniref:Uncharacterized protein n=1 Tax=Pleurodeles waltl TaxID=8319 RepID=A0AAV7R9P6_PLEWA|nr:hypothetical protein NDU88_001248 [Pleurodeles waltl]
MHTTAWACLDFSFPGLLSEIAGEALPLHPAAITSPRPPACAGHGASSAGVRFTNGAKGAVVSLVLKKVIRRRSSRGEGRRSWQLNGAFRRNDVYGGASGLLPLINERGGGRGQASVQRFTARGLGPEEPLGEPPPIYLCAPIAARLLPAPPRSGRKYLSRPGPRGLQTGAIGGLMAPGERGKGVNWRYQPLPDKAAVHVPPTHSPPPRAGGTTGPARFCIHPATLGAPACSCPGGHATTLQSSSQAAPPPRAANKVRSQGAF